MRARARDRGHAGAQRVVGIEEKIAQAQRHILEAHAERLSRETGRKVTARDIELGHAPRPKVLDMFAGGGAIPLEAMRLGCEVTAIDINPVAWFILKCTLEYPQRLAGQAKEIHGVRGVENLITTRSGAKAKAGGRQARAR